MTANELRIGNWVYWNGPSSKEKALIYSITKDEIIFYCGDSGLIEEIEGIPLTPKRLLKLGFIEFEDKTFIHDSLRYSDKFKLREDGVLVYVTSEVYITDLKYVHQLQNLFFELTRKELTYGK
jgi:hypothetical protein